MGDRRHTRHRVFVEDARGQGGYLRATWHPERRLFTISTWTGEVCTGVVRVPGHRAPELMSLFVDGLAELATPVDAPAGAAGPADAPGSASPGPGPRPGRSARPSPPPPRSGWPPAGWRSPFDGARRWLRDRGASLAPALLLRPGVADPPEDERTG
jgi:hypothetical protein